MNHSFVLNESSKDGETLILFSVYVKTEGRKFIFSTGEKIHPSEWDFENRQPNKVNGRGAEAQRHRNINSQLQRYPAALDDIVANYKLVQEVLTIKALRDHFNGVFKKSKKGEGGFLSVFEKFIEYKKKEGSIKQSTIKRYNNVKQVLEDFQTDTKYNLTFNRINKTFILEFSDYCRKVKEHTQNTLGRNVGAIKTFMNWAHEERFHFNLEYRKFKKVSAETNEVILTKKEIEQIWEYDFSENKRLERVRDLFYFGCVTGMRYSDYSVINRSDVDGDTLTIVTKKTSDVLSIPLNDYSRYILQKYNYELPIISEQKFREYIKEVCQKVGLTQPTKKTTFIGAERKEEILPKYKRISSHTARRTFISLSLEGGMRPEVVKEITGHKNLQSFEKYVKVNPKAKREEMNNVWQMNTTPLRKVK